MTTARKSEEDITDVQRFLVEQDFLSDPISLMGIDWGTSVSRF